MGALDERRPQRRITPIRPLRAGGSYLEEVRMAARPRLAAGPPVRLHAPFPARGSLVGGHDPVPFDGRRASAFADPGSYLRLHLRPGGTLYQRQDARPGPRPRARRPERPRGP